jgi:hypothetical protein
MSELLEPARLVEILVQVIGGLVTFEDLQMFLYPTNMPL